MYQRFIVEGEFVMVTMFILKVGGILIVPAGRGSEIIRNNGGIGI